MGRLGEVKKSQKKHDGEMYKKTLQENWCSFVQFLARP